jgi:thiol-disulfide isomerase/thioredoxin
MTKVRDAVALAVAILLGLGALYFGWTWRGKPSAMERTPAVVGSTISPGAFYSAAFPDLAGKRRSLGEWSGKVLVVNFWATWCEPCREEIPAFIRLQRKYADKGVVFLGLAIDDADKVRPYSTQIAVNYPILIAEAEGTEFGRRLGNSSGSLPYSALVDQAGNIVATRLGVFKEEQLERLLLSLLARGA